MNEHIELQQEKTEAKRIAKIVEQLKEKNRSQGPKIWEIKRKVSRAIESPHMVKNSQGKLMKN